MPGMGEARPARVILGRGFAAMKSFEVREMASEMRCVDLARIAHE